MDSFDSRVAGPSDGLCAEGIEALQVNVGLRCNQRCSHCHLECSPERTETMPWDVMAEVIEVAGRVRPGLVDVTGGAPEMNPHLPRLIEALDAGGLRVQVRTNLTAILEEGLGDIARVFRASGVRLVGSMPCYLEENVRAQRGPGIYERSIEALGLLNALGYGTEPDLELDLVYNPAGPVLPGSQGGLEVAYKRELGERFGIRFNRLIAIANMPVGRFRAMLQSESREREYLDLLRRSFNPRTVEGLMCRHQISIGWDGALYDCDFNLALGLHVDHGAPDRLSDFDPGALERRRIVTGEHCFGCTAGCGSSCRGALA
ncbi:MAG: arsenosugar biosynthesis radical SAM (seleno)protein ArsS [Planctomycetota bacterium]|jgi:radical SAM/Cys-rich protein